MFSPLRISIILIYLIFSSDFFSQTSAKQKNELVSKISFEENKGQFHDQNYKPRPDVLFGGSDGKLVFHLRNNGISYQLNKVISTEKTEKLKNKGQEIPKEISVYRVDINWLNCNSVAKHKTDKAHEGYNNYYLAGCRNGVLNVKSYKGVTLQEIYPGIDLHYYESKERLKYDYVVSPGADPKEIQFEVKGGIVKLDKDGSLIITTPIGEIKEQKPFVYQEKLEIPSRYIVKGNIVSFELGDYDKTKELIIDPETRLWGTYYGGTGTESGTACTHDAAGNVFLLGYTASAGGFVIATSGAHQTNLSGDYDAFLVKFGANGVRLWGTYYGDTNTETGADCETDNAGNVYLIGTTTSSVSGNIIATPGSHQVTSGGMGDGFIVKFSSNGVRLWASYYGGEKDDIIHGSTIDSLGNLYITGVTSSTLALSISSAGSHQNSLNWNTDAFLVKFSSNGTRLWGTYYGGGWFDEGIGCSVDKNNFVYVAGLTGSNGNNSISTPGAYQTNNLGSGDAFLAKFDQNGIRQWGTFYGGSSYDCGYACVNDTSGNVYLAGLTKSSLNISTNGSHQSAISGLNEDGFLVKFDSSGVRQWGTYYGGAGIDHIMSISSNNKSGLFVSGVSGSSTGVSTSGSYQPALNGSGFFAKFDLSGVLKWGSFYGNSSGYIPCISSYTNGDFYICGTASSLTGTVIASSNGHQPNYGGGNYDAFLVKFNTFDCMANTTTITMNSPACTGHSLSFSVAPTATGVASYTWTGPAGFTSTLSNPVISALTSSNNGTYSLTLFTAAGCYQQDTANVFVYTSPVVAANSGSICSGKTYTIMPGGTATSFSLYSGNNLFTPTFNGSYTLTPNTNTNYTLTGYNSVGCSNTATCMVNVYQTPTITILQSDSLLCIGSTVTLTASGANSYSWNVGATTTSTLAAQLFTQTVFNVTGVSANGCQANASITQSVTSCDGLGPEREKESNYFSVYPNPIQNYAYVKGDAAVFNIKVYNLLGEEIMKTVVSESNPIIDLTNVSSGTYWIEVSGISLRKWVKVVKL